MTSTADHIDALLQENRIFEPPAALVENSNIMQWMRAHGIADLEQLRQRAEDPEWFWPEVAKDLVEFYEPYTQLLDWQRPYAKWFVGAKYNIVHDAVDRHAQGPRRDKVAYLYEGEPGDKRSVTYGELAEQVNRLANALRRLGIGKGDRVAIYMPMVPELPIAMLACAKIGAPHAVVFSGFSAAALRDRIEDSQAKAIITADGFYRRGRIINLKEVAQEAADQSPSVEHVVVFQRLERDAIAIPWTEGRDHWWHDLTAVESAECETERLDANDMLYLLYTSGTTGKPKGIIHAHAGYAVQTALTLKWVFDLKDDDVWWCAADIGWVTGHSYIVYAPLILGVTSVMYEGAPDTPTPDRWWDMVERYRVSVLYTSPTSIRMFMRLGDEWPAKHDLSSLRLLGSVGEPINPEAWVWYYKQIGGQRCPIMDTWWQTETGGHCITPLPITPLKPGSATQPFPGIQAAVLDSQGNEAPPNAGGLLVLRTPWPGMLRGIYGDLERFQSQYWSQYPQDYLAGDVARIDQDGYFWVQGRADDVLKVAGHRIGNSEVESALVSHPMVAEAAVIGKPHEIKGESIVAYVVLNNNAQPSDTLRAELREHVAHEIGGIARPDEVWFVSDVPKTRSGKIMRRIVRSKAIGEPVGDISTLANPEAVEEIDKAH